MFKFFKRKQPKKPNVGKLCDCSGSVTMDRMWEVERAPLLGGFHTAFVVGTCTKCGGFVGFPDHNLNLAITEGTEDTLKHLQDIGFEFGIKFE